MRIHIHSTIGLCLLISSTAFAEDAPVRKQIPDTAAIKTTTRDVRELFKVEYGKAAPDAKSALAKTLFDQGIASKDDAAATYVLLREAQDLASQAGDSGLTLKALGAIGDRFEINVASEMGALLTKMAATARTPEAARALAEIAVSQFDEALSKDQWDALAPLANVLSLVGPKAGDPTFAAYAQDRSLQSAQIQKDLPAVRAAIEKLKTEPTDPESNLLVGKFRCFTLGNWEAGLPALALGSDPVLKALAAEDLAPPADAASKVALADKWIGIAEKQPSLVKRTISGRAVFWYQSALPDLSGLGKTKAEKRIAELSGNSKIAPAARTPTWISKNATYKLSSIDGRFPPKPSLLNGEGRGHAVGANDDFAFHTKDETDAHIIIDLQDKRTISALEIVNRRKFSEKAASLVVWVSNATSGPWVEVWQASKNEPKWDIKLANPAYARYVKLGLKQKNNFHLSTVKILGW